MDNNLPNQTPVCSTENPICHIPLGPNHQHANSFSPRTEAIVSRSEHPIEPAIPIKITHTDKYSEKNDPPMVDLKVTNPVSYFKKWVDHLLKNQDIDIHLRIKPFATIGLFLAFAAVGSTTFSIGRYLFPNSSPILHRQVVYTGTIKQEGTQSLLVLANSTQWKLKPKASEINLSNLSGRQVVVTGNLNAQPNLIDVSEVIVAENPSPSSVEPQLPVPVIETETTSVNFQEGPEKLPNLPENIKWETTQKKILTFTSGKRRIEQEGVYLESILLKDYPQEFISYYFSSLTNLGFKETLNSADPNGVMITYAKGETFVTFGVKNIYTGSGDNKKLSGYKAYLEHN